LEVVKEFQGNENKEISRMSFLMLGLDLPPPPLFKDVMEKNIIPQVYGYFKS
jgi:U4/U6.U5 tri-snRNP-associated protein 2